MVSTISSKFIILSYYHLLLFIDWKDSSSKWLICVQVQLNVKPYFSLLGECIFMPHLALEQLCRRCSVFRLFVSAFVIIYWKILLARYLTNRGENFITSVQLGTKMNWLDVGVKRSKVKVTARTHQCSVYVVAGFLLSAAIVRCVISLLTLNAVVELSCCTVPLQQFLWQCHLNHIHSFIH